MSKHVKFFKASNYILASITLLLLLLLFGGWGGGGGRGGLGKRKRKQGKKKIDYNDILIKVFNWITDKIEPFLFSLIADN